MLSVVYWAATISFVTFCQKIPLINRTFKNKWAMFAFQISGLLAPLYLYTELDAKAITENYYRLYAFT